MCVYETSELDLETPFLNICFEIPGRVPPLLTLVIAQRKCVKVIGENEREREKRLAPVCAHYRCVWCVF